MGSKGSSGGGGSYSSSAPATVTPTTSTTTSSIPPEVLANYQAIVGAAQNVASKPLQQYSGPMLAGFTPQQNAGFSNVDSAVGSYQPYFDQAKGMVNNATTFNPATLQQYMSPYTNDVIKSTMDLAHQNDAQQQQALTGNAISKGAWGGDRAGVAQAALAGQQQLADNSTMANLENQNYAQGLGAMQNANAQQLTGASTLGTMGNAAQANNLAGASAQLQAGQLQQTQAQNALNIPYEQFQQQQQYPFQTTGWLANIVEGLGANQGGSSTTTTGPAHAAGGRVRLASGGDVPNADINVVGMPTGNWATANLPGSGTGGAMVQGPNGQMVPQSSLLSQIGGAASGLGSLASGAAALGGWLGGGAAAASTAGVGDAIMSAAPLLLFHNGGSVPHLASGGDPTAINGLSSIAPVGATSQSMSDVVAGTPVYSFDPMASALRSTAIPSTANNFKPAAAASTSATPASVAYGQPGDPAGWATSNNLVALPDLTSTQLSALAADYPKGNTAGTASDPYAGRADKYAYRTASGMGFAPPPGSIYATAINGSANGGRISHLAGGGVPSANYEIVPTQGIHFADAKIPGSDTRGAVANINKQGNYLSDGLGALTTGFGLYKQGQDNGWWGQPADFSQSAQDAAFSGWDNYLGSNTDSFMNNLNFRSGGAIPHLASGGILNSDPLSGTGIGSMGPTPIGATTQSMSSVVPNTPVYSFDPNASAASGSPVQSTANNFIPVPKAADTTPAPTKPADTTPNLFDTNNAAKMAALLFMTPSQRQTYNATNTTPVDGPFTNYMNGSQSHANGGVIGRYDDGGGIPQGVPTNADNVLDPMSQYKAFQQSPQQAAQPSANPVDTAIQQITQPSAPSQPAAPEDTGLGAYQDMVKKPDWGQALTTAGLAMMAGHSPNALANIGEGGLAGMQNYEQQKATQRDAQAKAVELAQKAEQLQQANMEVSKDAIGNPVLVNKTTGEAKPLGNMSLNTLVNSDLKGDDYLASLPTAQRGIVRAIANGDQPFPSGFALKSPYWIDTMNKVYAYDSTANGNRFNAVKSFNTGTQGDQVRFFGNAIGHFDTLDKLTNALGNGDVKAVNSLQNTFKDQFGQTAPSNFSAVKNVVSDEVVKVIVGRGGALADREKAKADIDAAKSPEQLHQVIAQYKDLLNTQLGGLEQQYVNSTGRKDFADRLTPAGRAEYLGAKSAPNQVTDAAQSAPPGGKLIGTSGGKAVYAMPDGSHVMEQ